MNMVTLYRDSATTEDLFEIITTLVARLERAEEVICALAGGRLAQEGAISAPPPEIAKGLTAELLDYVVLIDEARRRNAADEAFLTARE